MMVTYTEFPGGSKSRVNSAGEAVRTNKATYAELRTIDEWRAAHRAVLNTFQAILRVRTRKRPIVVAQRHKRRRTIFDKLQRFPKMQLARMDDVAGCRLIFESLEDLYEFRDEFQNARFKHRRRNDLDKYDYIKRPKATGYRGIHDVYEYDVRSEAGQALTGLNVEIQYRTLVQHAWATAVEVIGLITESQPKFRQGDDRYEKAMALASEILARTEEQHTGPFPDMSGRKLVARFLALDEELVLLGTLRGLNAADDAVSKNKNAILMFTEVAEGEDDFEILTYRDATTAVRALFELEKMWPERDVVLVRADTNAEVRLAFKNYFSDAQDFLQMIDAGCMQLSRR